MRITHKLLVLYREGVDLGLDIKLNLRTKDGEEFFSFSRVSRPIYRRRRRNRDLMSNLKEVRLPLKEVWPPEGSKVPSEGSAVPSEGSAVFPEGSVVPPEGSAVPSEGSAVPP